MVGSVGSGYIFVINTDSYAGNFERQMCAFITGMIPDCGTGADEAIQFAKDENLDVDGDYVEGSPFEDIINRITDDHNNSTPCSIWPTAGYYNAGNGETKPAMTFEDENKYPAYNSVAIFFTEKPSDELIAMMKNRAREFAKDVTRFVDYIKNPTVVNILRFDLLMVVPEKYIAVKM